MALSSDPAKRERQLAGLRKGQEALARKILAASEADAAEAPAKASKGRGGAPRAKTAKAAKARSQGDEGDDAVIRYPRGDDAPPKSRQKTRRRADAQPKPVERRERPRRGGGFLDGFLGRF